VHRPICSRPRASGRNRPEIRRFLVLTPDATKSVFSRRTVCVARSASTPVACRGPRTG
jgi:hypothetical protein